MTSIQSRKEVFKNCRNVVIKVGTRLLTDTARIPELIRQIHLMRKNGYNVILVSSGAVGLGMKALGLTKRPSKLAETQALAAIGQNKLMAIYEKECQKFNFSPAQLLLTADDLRDRKRYINIINCIHALWAKNILPIINENDSVSIDALRFGDNDILSAYLGAMTRCQLTIILTTVDGLHSKIGNQLGERISIVDELSDEIRALATGTDDAALSIGGMASKLNAAEITMASGEYLWIADGREDGIIDKILEGEDVGTLFVPSKKQMQGRKRWISFFSKVSGQIIIDDGAKTALIEKGKSLLPSGVLEIKGKFQQGDTVEICCSNGVVLAKGLVNFDSEFCHKIMGKHSSEIGKNSNGVTDNEIIHRDNLVLS